MNDRLNPQLLHIVSYVMTLAGSSVETYGVILIFFVCVINNLAYRFRAK